MQQRNDEPGPKPHYAVISIEAQYYGDDLKKAEQEAIDKARMEPGRRFDVVQLVGAFATQPPRVERVPLAEVLA